MSELPITATRSRSSIGRLSVLALVAIVALVVFGRELIVGDLPSEEEQVLQITNLETTVLPIVEELRVEYYMDQEGCTILTYERGDFVDGEPDCGGTTSTPVRFDGVDTETSVMRRSRRPDRLSRHDDRDVSVRDRSTLSVDHAAVHSLRLRRRD